LNVDNNERVGTNDNSANEIRKLQDENNMLVKRNNGKYGNPVPGSMCCETTGFS
jgi:hypothetical protein